MFLKNYFSTICNIGLVLLIAASLQGCRDREFNDRDKAAIRVVELANGVAATHFSEIPTIGNVTYNGYVFFNLELETNEFEYVIGDLQIEVDFASGRMSFLADNFAGENIGEITGQLAGTGLIEKNVLGDAGTGPLHLSGNMVIEGRDGTVAGDVLTYFKGVQGLAITGGFDALVSFGDSRARIGGQMAVTKAE